MEVSNEVKIAVSKARQVIEARLKQNAAERERLEGAAEGVEFLVGLILEEHNPKEAPTEVPAEAVETDETV